MKIVTLKAGKLLKTNIILKKTVFSVDVINSRNPTNLEKNDSEKNVEKNIVLQDHHLIKNTRVIVLDKLTAREI